ncbi:MAG: hypothetical protein ACYC56_02410 [Candidatus Aquicultor sp.]
MLKKRIFLLLVATFLTVLSVANTAYAGYARSSLANHNYRGIKGGFLIPNTDSKWQLHARNFINFEEWMAVHNSSDWFEMGYTDGDMDHSLTDDGQVPDPTPDFYYKGAFKGKSINGVYVEWELNKSLSVGQRYAFEISDTNNDNIWNIFINGTSYGTFSDSVSSVDAASNYMGYEYLNQTGASQNFGTPVDVNSQNYLSQGSWRRWNGPVNVGVDNVGPYIYATWNSGGNSTTIQSY